VAPKCDSGDEDEGFREGSQGHSLRNRSAAARHGLCRQTSFDWVSFRLSFFFPCGGLLRAFELSQKFLLFLVP